MHKPYLFLLDLDHTLFDATRLKGDISEELLAIVTFADRVEKFWQLEKSFRQQPNYLVKTIKYFCDHFQLADTQQHQIQEIFLQIPSPKYIFPDVLPSLAQLSTVGESAIFSQGDHLFQQWKIQQAHLSEHVDYVYVFDDKLSALPAIIKKFPNREIWYVDNHLKNLARANQLDSQLQTCLIRRESFETNSQFIPSAIVTSLEEFAQLIVATDKP